MRDIPTSPRIIEIRRKRRLRMIRISILYFLLFITIIFVLAFFSTSKKFKIENIKVEGNHIIDQEEVEKEIIKNMEGKYLHLFSRSNSLIYPYGKIYNSLLINFPRIESLSINRIDFRTLKIGIAERTGSFLYCGEDIPIEKKDIGENCYFVNNDGLIFDQAPYFSGNIYFKYYLRLSDNNKILGQQMIPVENFHQMTRFVDSLVDLGLKPIYIVLDQDGTNYLYLDHSANNIAPKIIFKNDADLEILKNNFYISMQKKEFVDEINSKYSTLLYIDLRFKNKILYKFSTQSESAPGGQ